MPGIVRFVDPKSNVEGDLLGTPILDKANRQTGVVPLTGTSAGVWIELKSYDKVSVGLIGTAAATLRICGSNAVVKPLDSYDGYPLFADYVYAAPFEEIVAIKTPVRWLKVNCVANSGAVTAPIIGV